MERRDGRRETGSEGGGGGGGGGKLTNHRET